MPMSACLSAIDAAWMSPFSLIRLPNSFLKTWIG